MNGAFALLAAILLVCGLMGSAAFTNPIERGMLLSVLAAAHLSQFAFNVPILRNGEHQGESYWMVRAGPMLFIFAVDAFQTVVHVAAAAVQFNQ